MSLIFEVLIYLGISAFIVALVAMAAGGSVLAVFLLWAFFSKKV